MLRLIFIAVCWLFGLFALSGQQFIISAFVNNFDDVRLHHTRTVRFAVSSNLYEGDEDDVPIPFTATVYLLPESAVEILKRKKFTPTDEDGKPLNDEQDYLDAAAYSLSRQDDENALPGFLITEGMEENKIVRLQTGANGQETARAEKTGGDFGLQSAF